MPDSGAVEGLRGVLLWIFNVAKDSRINAIMNDIEKDIKECDLVINGEGCTDAQTIEEKVPSGIVRVALKYNKPRCNNQRKAYENPYKFSNIIGVYSTLQKALSLMKYQKC